MLKLSEKLERCAICSNVCESLLNNMCHICREVKEYDYCFRCLMRSIEQRDPKETRCSRCNTKLNLSKEKTFGIYFNEFVCSKCLPGVKKLVEDILNDRDL